MADNGLETIVKLFSECMYKFGELLSCNFGDYNVKRNEFTKTRIPSGIWSCLYGWGVDWASDIFLSRTDRNDLTRASHISLDKPMSRYRWCHAGSDIW